MLLYAADAHFRHDFRFAFFFAPYAIVFRCADIATITIDAAFIIYATDTIIFAATEV